jgi:hypothetical protein
VYTLYNIRNSSFYSILKVKKRGDVSTTPWRRMGEFWYSSTILDLSTRLRWLVNFTPRPLYSRENSPSYPLNRRLGEPQSRSGRCGEEKNLLPLPRIESRPSSPSLYRLYVGCYRAVAVAFRIFVWWTEPTFEEYFLLRCSNSSPTFRRNVILAACFLCGHLLWISLRPWKWHQYVPLKRSWALPPGSWWLLALLTVRPRK